MLLSGNESEPQLSPEEEVPFSQWVCERAGSGKLKNITQVQYRLFVAYFNFS